MKPKKSVKKVHPKKVFDVMRPGKTAAGATSRPVIVGHKPQIKDPMMSERDNTERSLLDSKQKVALAPAASATTEQASTPAQQAQATTELQTPLELTPAEKAPETVAAVALADTVETPAPVTPLDAPAQTPVATPQQTPVAQEPAEGVPRPATMPETKDSTGIIFEDIPTADETTTVTTERTAGTPPESAEPLPVLPPEELPKAQIFVAHHSSSTSGLKLFLILFAVIILAVIALDVMLDAGFVTLNGIPHTDLL